MAKPKKVSQQKHRQAPSKKKAKKQDLAKSKGSKKTIAKTVKCVAQRATAIIMGKREQNEKASPKQPPAKNLTKVDLDSVIENLKSTSKKQEGVISFRDIN